MKGLRRFLIWGLVFCVLLAGMDQLLLKVPLPAPGVREVQVFYRDFRNRLLAMFGATGRPSIEQLIDAAEKKPAVKPATAVVPLKTAVPAVGKTYVPSRRYLYVDQDGALQFADSLQQVPRRFRASAQPLKD
ncbi:hypothetical protein B5V00_12585 [Geothermobacter hydrogeniphilus]|uniref:DUF4124 domain-containing protein n=1 Tax=Geothermobacter hydrogeniphilus TaxID=1969733 RepID=A0A1X0XZD8_9BACT|nr:hypothetical protein B5V00_12585 [Geothermobacter hydrogeniphilus]